MHYFYGVLVQPGGVSTTSAFRRHAAIVVAVFLLTRAVSLLDRYSLDSAAGGPLAGAMLHGCELLDPGERYFGDFALLVAIMFVVAASMNR